MNRELKFRVWCKGTSTNANFNKPRWILPTDFILLKYYRCFQDVIESDDFVVHQYTGLQDRDGKDIYEGDILEYQSSDSEFSTCIVRWTQEYEDNHPGFVITNNYSQYGKPKIISNIFENPELIKTNE